LVGAASVAAYTPAGIRSTSSPAREGGRPGRQIDALNAQTGPVFLVYRSEATIDGELAGVARRRPRSTVTGVTACGTSVDHQRRRHGGRLTAAFDRLPALYVATAITARRPRRGSARTPGGQPGAHREESTTTSWP